MGEESKWYGYLQSLPTSVVPNALFWGHDAAGMGDDDGREARAWLNGTEAEKEFCDEHGVDTVHELHEYYSRFVQPLFNKLDKPCTLPGFVLAYSLPTRLTTAQTTIFTSSATSMCAQRAAL